MCDDNDDENEQVDFKCECKIKLTIQYECVFAAFVQLTQFQMELKRKQHVNFDIANNFIFLCVRSFERSFTYAFNEPQST